MRVYPKFSTHLPAPKRAISFVCVKYSNEFEHNIAQSNCVTAPLNEFIVVDNSDNLFFDTVSQAVNHGIKRANNNVVVIIHEDVLLPDYWQSAFEEALSKLTAHDPDWLVAGIAGWDNKQKPLGTLYEPGLSTHYCSEQPYQKAALLNSQLLVIRQPCTLFLDPNLPRHHHLGLDLAMQAQDKGRNSYVLNAPCLHQYANEIGQIIHAPHESTKLQQKQQLGYLAGRACADEYIQQKWPLIPNNILHFEQPGPFQHAYPPSPALLKKTEQLSKQQQSKLNRPFILLAKGGGGSRLLSILANDAGLFIGNDVNPTGDSREMARAIYRAVFRQYACPSEKQNTATCADLKATALNMLEQADWPNNWAFKVPESLFALDALQQAFPNARYIFLKRDPLTTSLRGTHMTARADNPIGQITLKLAYDADGIERQHILTDNKAIKLARTSQHQLRKVLSFKEKIASDDWLELAFEDLLHSPKAVLNTLGAFTGLPLVSSDIENSIDQQRATINPDEHSIDTIIKVEAILKNIRATLGYK